MTTKASPLTRIALLAIENKEAVSLWMMVDRFMAKDYVIGLPASADIAILDGDAPGFSERLGTWRSGRPHAGAIVLSSQTRPNAADVVFVQKPVRMADLAGGLDNLRSRAKRATAPGSQRTSGSATVAATNDSLRVNICMSTDPSEMLDMIGIRSDIMGNIGRPQNRIEVFQQATA